MKDIFFRDKFKNLARRQFRLYKLNAEYAADRRLSYANTLSAKLLEDALRSENSYTIFVRMVAPVSLLLDGSKAGVASPLIRVGKLEDLNNYQELTTVSGFNTLQHKLRGGDLGFITVSEEQLYHRMVQNIIKAEEDIKLNPALLNDLEILMVKERSAFLNFGSPGSFIEVRDFYKTHCTRESILLEMSALLHTKNEELEGVLNSQATVLPQLVSKVEKK